MRLVAVLISFSILSLLVLSGCEKDNSSSLNLPPISEVTVWSGPDIAFVKADDASPDVEANQDRITNNVWITRGNEGGQIYNVREESSSTKETSPAGTAWAVGTTANLENLTFAPFRTAVDKPQEVVGQDLVMMLIDDKIAIDVRFTSWSSGKNGGFAYERSSN